MIRRNLKSKTVFIAIVSIFILSSHSRLCAQSGAPVADPFGDAMDTFGQGGPLLDVALFNLGYDQQNLYFTINFFTPIAAGSELLPESLSGVLELDVDQDLSSGAPAVQNFFSPPFETLPIGADFLIDFGSEASSPGFVQLTTWEHIIVSLIPVTFENAAVHGVIPLADLGGDDGRLNFTSTIGTFPQPTDATDRVGTSYAIPEPATAILLPTLFAMLYCRRNRTKV